VNTSIPTLAKWIDQTLLKPEATTADILNLCEQAKVHSFFGVCVNSSYIKLVVESLAGSSSTPVSVVGFPLGAMSTISKAFETEQCVRDGAKEIDMVIAIGALKEKRFDFVKNDVRAVVQAAGPALVKVIIETALLTDEEKKIACSLSVEAGAGFVKTCTGFSGGAASVADIELMRAVVGPQIGVKASGGVKTAELAWALIKAGATRIGTSSGVELAQNKTIVGGY
jgi:deoxyribose-phosphate aldolase